MTSPASARSITVTAAEVSIRLVSVADKPMTISIFNQLPKGTELHHGDEPLGWINRHPLRCLSGQDDPWAGAPPHRHVLVARAGEPVLVEVDLSRPRRISGDPPDAHLSDLRLWQAKQTLVNSLPQLYIAR